MLDEALEHLVTGIVDHKDDVVVRQKNLRRGTVLEVRVHLSLIHISEPTRRS